MTGKAVEKCALELKDKICTLGAQLLGLDKAAVLFTGDAVTSEDGTQRVPLASIIGCAGRIGTGIIGGRIGICAQNRNVFQRAFQHFGSDLRQDACRPRAAFCRASAWR